MKKGIYIETERLLLRDWKETDKPKFALINGNPHVMRYFPGCLTSEESDRFVARIVAELEVCGHGLFAVEIKDTGEFIGYVGLHAFEFEAPFSPGWEIGWRLSDRHWHKGYATEAAAACIDYARGAGLIRRLYSFTAVVNRPSENVMKRIGMIYAGRFEHPALPCGHPLREHLLYELDLHGPGERDA